MGDETREWHIERHKQLHAMLDELAADYVMCTNGLLSRTSVMDLTKWSYQQTFAPAEPVPPWGSDVRGGEEQQVHAVDSVQELTVQAVRVGAALVLRIARGSDLVAQWVLGPGEQQDIDCARERGPIVVNGAEVRVSFSVTNRG